ncbi:hypothetical protein QJQ45_023214, partial [Haematococcus lacustris]
ATTPTLAHCSNRTDGFGHLRTSGWSGRTIYKLPIRRERCRLTCSSTWSSALKVEVRLRRKPHPDTNASDTPSASIASSPAPQPATGSKAQPAAAADSSTSHTSPAAEASSSQGEAPAPEVDPRTLHLLLRFTPWAGEEVVLAPVPLTFTPDGAAAAATAGFSTAPPPPLVA